MIRKLMLEHLSLVDDPKTHVCTFVSCRGSKVSCLNFHLLKMTQSVMFELLSLVD